MPVSTRPGLTTRSSEQRLAAGSFSWLSLSSPASVAELEFVRPLAAMTIKRLLILLGAVLVCIVLYGYSYTRLPFCEAGRARGIETYVFTRDFTYDWEVYAFVPAGYVESWLIRLFPKPFLSNPSWLESGYPRRVLLKSDRVRVWLRASP